LLLAGAIALTTVFGFAGTWRVLGASAAPQLRHD
jgi:predicted lysophospholipase L1 biosynthesis ABC-type transport system permease subunit